jgi:hypothetical protein
METMGHKTPTCQGPYTNYFINLNDASLREDYYAHLIDGKMSSEKSKSVAPGEKWGLKVGSTDPK